MSANPMFDGRQLTVAFERPSLLNRLKGRTPVLGLRAVDVTVRAGETLGLVGESGSGKSTLARALLRINRLSSGALLFQGKDITTLEGVPLRELRRRLQMIFQDPFGSLNPRMSIGRAIAESLVVHDLARGRELDERVAASLEMVGLSPRLAARMPHEFSGGQRQRICIARALCCRPEFIACDEVLSALDISLQGQMLELLAQLKAQLGLTYLFISHDLRVVKRISDRVAVMYLGRIVELAPTSELYAHPAHPYTAALLAAIPTPDPVAERARRFAPLPGELPSPAHPPPGCAFHERCAKASTRCRSEQPPLAQIAPDHQVACFHPN
jgi:oligopeptide/dipeptide ABC transporter ATP-binding protein